MAKQENLFFGIFLLVIGLSVTLRAYILGNGLNNLFWDHILLIFMALISAYGGSLIWSKK